MKTWKINSSQLAAFITFLMVTPISGISLLNVINTSGVDSYLSVIFMAILGLIPLAIIIYISNYNHDLNIIDINKYLCTIIYRNNNYMYLSKVSVNAIW